MEEEEAAAGETEPDQPDPWATAIESGNAPKPKAAEERDSWGGFDADKVEPLPEDLLTKPAGGGGKKAWKTGKAAPSGPNLPRNRVSEEKVTGQVLEWKGKYGWIMPMVPVHHSKAYKHSGKIYLSYTDLGGESSHLKPGTLCEFFIFEDDAGLGAEECTVIEPAAWPGKKGDWGKDKGGKGWGGWGGSQSGGSRPSAERGGRGGGRKGGGGKGGGGKFGGGSDATQSGFAAPDLASLSAGSAGLNGAASLTRGGAAPSGRGRGDGGSKGRGRGAGDGFGGGRGGGRKGGKSSSDGGAPGRGNMPAGKGGGFTGRGLGIGAGAPAPGGGSEILQNVPGGGTWDAYGGRLLDHSQRSRPPAAEAGNVPIRPCGYKDVRLQGRSQQEQKGGHNPLGNQGGFPQSLSDGRGREHGLPHAAPTYMDPSRRGPDPLAGSFFDPSRPPDSLMSQSPFPDQSRGMPMVQDPSGLDPQRAWELMRSLNMQAPMAAGGLGGIGPGFGQPFPGAPGSAPFPAPSFAGAGFGFGPGAELEGFPRPLDGYPGPAP